MMSRAVILLGICLMCSLMVGCPGTVYECQCYCVRQVPLDEIELTEEGCVIEGVEPAFAVAMNVECPAGYKFSGCEDCAQKLDEFGDPEECLVGGSRMAGKLSPIPDPKFK